jgi:1,4-dihydroxy-6-naphthoate synthase
MPLIYLAHSPDPDDAFMWWPITGKLDVGPGLDAWVRSALATPSITESAVGRPPTCSGPVLDTGDLHFAALPADIELLNKRAASTGDLDITALSFRAYPDVKHRYALTACGSSFGDGFGPKVVARRALTPDALRDPSLTIAVPGKRTTAFLMLGLVLGPEALRDPRRCVEVPFDRIIPRVAEGEFDAGLVIHEGQVLFEQAGLRLVLDVGAWWKENTGLPLPLGANALRRDLETRLGPGGVSRVARLLRASIDHALAHREESLRYTMPFALANVARGGGPNTPSLDRIDRYVRMYVNDWTLDMGAQGRESLRRLLAAGHEAGLCPDPGVLDIVACS